MCQEIFLWSGLERFEPLECEWPQDGAKGNSAFTSVLLAWVAWVAWADDSGETERTREGITKAY